ncbi:EKC/KEOPS complex subunit GON7 isoform X1 [Rhineura floridana]|uniref:EKC/KEOPS complex subunit GON7 isoform X1 n=1 Tax=Rhineura floridana TaxID=261503 RepID=UPI002AC7F4BC|nr:EKC/KEOPS complex subunit GON7 isoform X1 [Rhineura floridana]
MELRAELTNRDGLKRPLRVRCEPQGELRGLISGLAQLREQVSALLGPLVQQESGAGDQPGPESKESVRGSTGDEDEQDEDDENHVNAKACSDGPPLKRAKIQS